MTPISGKTSLTDQITESSWPCKVKNATTFENAVIITIIASTIKKLYTYDRNHRGMPWLIAGVGLGLVKVVTQLAKYDFSFNALSSRFHYRGAKKIVITRNKTKEGLTLRKLPRYEAEEYQKLADDHHLPPFKETMYEQSKGRCFGAVTYFFQRTLQLDSAEEAAQEFEGGLPWQAACYQKIDTNMPLSRDLPHPISTIERTFNLAGLGIEENILFEGERADLLNSITSDLQPGLYYMSIPTYDRNGEKMNSHALGFILEGESCHFIDPNKAIGEFDKLEAREITSRIIKTYGEAAAKGPYCSPDYSLYTYFLKRLGPKTDCIQCKSPSAAA